MMRNSPIVLAFKKQLVREFYKIAEELRKITSSEHQKMQKELDDLSDGNRQLKLANYALHDRQDELEKSCRRLTDKIYGLEVDRELVMKRDHETAWKAPMTDHQNIILQNRILQLEWELRDAKALNRSLSKANRKRTAKTKK